MTCAECGRPIPNGARFCPNCGAPVSTTPLGTEERKVVTVLFADLVDSTGLAQRLDPERAREVLGRFFDAAGEELRTLRGQPEKFIGDAVMAVFGLPQVHEDDAVRAVRAGLAIRERIRRVGRSLGLPESLEIRVGIESGEAAMGVRPSQQLLVTGPVVNAAARLQAAARPGEVVVGETTHELTISAVSFGPLRCVEAKGFDRALVAHPVEALTSRSTRRTIPIVGRLHELALLRDAFDRTASSGRPLLCTLLGEPGIGKSRLADELVASLGSDATVLGGRSQAYSDGATFAPAAAIIRTLAGVEDGASSSVAVERLQTFAAGLLEPSDADRVSGCLALALGVSKDQRDDPSFVQEVQSGVLAVLERIAAQTPVVVVLEDAHALRGPMLDLIERMAARSRRGPVRAMVLALARPELVEERPSWGSGAANHVMIRLEPLSMPDAVELARESSGGRVEGPAAVAIAERTGGNPFFIVEITGMLLRRGDESVDGNGALPATVQAVVAARIDGLAGPLRDFTRRISAFLYSFDLDEVGLVTDGGLPELRELEEQEIVVREDAARASNRWRFVHETLRDVAYASLPKRERVRLHLAIARGLRDRGHVSYAADHMERGAIASLDLDPADRSIADAAADALVAAGDRARRRLESRSAVDYYQRGLAMAGPEAAWGVREARALAGTGEARYWLGEYPAAIESLDRALAVNEPHGDERALAEALCFRAEIALNFDGDAEEAEALFRRSLSAAEELGDPVTIARTLLFAGWVSSARHDFDEAERVWRRALDLSERTGDRWAQARALTSLSIGRAEMDDRVEATRLIERAERVAGEMGDQFSVAVATVQRGRLCQDEGDPAEAVRRFDSAIETFAELGARWEVADATAERGLARRELGDLDGAERDLQGAIRISEELGERQLASWSWRALARVSQKRGDRAEAEERMRRADEEEARPPG